jgi:hypothetical protein
MGHNTMAKGVVVVKWSLRISLFYIRITRSINEFNGANIEEITRIAVVKNMLSNLEQRTSQAIWKQVLWKQVLWKQII